MLDAGTQMMCGTSGAAPRSRRHQKPPPSQFQGCLVGDWQRDSPLMCRYRSTAQRMADGARELWPNTQVIIVTSPPVWDTHQPTNCTDVRQWECLMANPKRRGDCRRAWSSLAATFGPGRDACEPNDLIEMFNQVWREVASNTSGAALIDLHRIWKDGDLDRSIIAPMWFDMHHVANHIERISLIGPMIWLAKHKHLHAHLDKSYSATV